MKRKKNRKATGVTGILLCLVLLGLVGNVFLLQNLNREKGLIKQLQKERSDLEERKELAALDLKGLQDEEEKLQEALASKSQDKEAAAESDGTQSAPQDGNPVSARIPAVQESVSAILSGRSGSGENWQVYVRRLSDHAQESFGEGRMIAASLIKLYIMGAVYESYDVLAAQNGKDYIDSLLRAMITVSDNDSANALTEMLGQGDAAAGRTAVTDYCIRNGYNDSSMGRMLLETGTENENYTSAQDCGTFLERVYGGELPYGEEMMSLLKQQERREKIPSGVPEGTVVANKTGELANVENDAAVVFMENSPYILCVLSENVGATSAARQAIRDISSAVYLNIY